MGFVGVLPEVPSFGASLARNLGGGISHGLGVATDFASKLAMEKYKNNLRQQLINQIEGGEGTPSAGEQLAASASAANAPSFQSQIMPMADASKTSAGAPGVSGAQRPKQEDSFRKAKLYAAAGEESLAKISAEEAKQTRKEKFAQEQQERDILAIEPKKFLEDVGNYRKGARDIDLALGAELDAVLSGDTEALSPGHISELIKQFGLPQAAAAPFETVGSKAFRTGQKTFLSKTFKDAFRGNTSQGQIELASSLLAEMGTSREGNLASIWLLQSQHMIEKERVRLTDAALEQGVPVYKLPRYVERQLDVYAKDINDQYFDALKALRGLERK